MTRRSRDAPQEPGYVPSRPPEQPLIHRLAENGEITPYTDEEYGVRKDGGAGITKPVNSSRGLLFLAILLTACVGGLVYALVQVALTDQWHILGEVWWVFPATLFPFLAAWAGYAKERKAEKLRRTKNLPRPVD